MRRGASSPHPSLCPPRHGYPPDDDNGAPPPSWVLLDLHAYVADRENATSAYGVMSDGKAIRATFCTAPPPLVSDICVWCPGLPPTELAMEPTIEAAEADFVLFRVSLSGHRSRRDCFVYKAPSGGKGPSLSRLEKPDPYLLYRHSTALLANRNIGRGGRISPHADDDDEDGYYIVTLNHDLDRPGSFNLWLFNSMDKKWTSSPVSLGIRRVHVTAKVQDNGGTLQPSLGRHHFAHPTLSLSDSHVVYLMGKVGLCDMKTFTTKKRFQGRVE
ncbi:hypothetical protein BAE44_0015691 [Dichanthelium oligosanthes]|uniref:DUF1618 domain-containing protein n=1 Tax=Dichanthelium oligosanthes TaxID=888268 RepID=A0A1E5VDV6_9POAL|nr:hypothetical protein BAE44_0015691 [Dichanthelium oligosanthes]